MTARMNMTMTRWMFGVSLEEKRQPSTELRRRLGVDAIVDVLIARVTRADRRRMVELREETRVQRSLTERLVRSRLQ